MKNRESFLINEYVSFSIIAGLATRNSKSPIYSKSVSEQERNELKKTIREYLIKLYENVQDKEVSDMEQLCNYCIPLYIFGIGMLLVTFADRISCNTLIN